MNSLKYIILALMMTIFSLIALSQDYPRIEIDKNGKKTVVFTIEQAQRIDSDLEIYELLKKSRIQCDSLNIASVRLIDALNQKVVICEKAISELSAQYADKERQVALLQSQDDNQKESIKLLEEQKCIKDKQIKDLREDVEKQKRNRWIFGGIGLAIGLLFSFAG
jgi:hypothetical protein